jgi:predicted amidohydrolase YtcJ
MLDVLEQVKSERGELRGRHTLSHVELVRDDDLQRIVDLGIIIQTTPYWHRPEGFDGIAVSRPDRPEAFRFRWLIDNGVRVTFGSDFPTTFDDYGLPPLYNIEVGHTRRTQGRRDGARLGGEAKRLTVEELIRGYTLDAAYQLRMEHLVGSIEVGKRADLVVLTDDIMQVPPERIHKVDVVLTMVDGRLVYESNFLTRWLFRLFF